MRLTDFLTWQSLRVVTPTSTRVSAADLAWQGFEIAFTGPSGLLRASLNSHPLGQCARKGKFPSNLPMHFNHWRHGAPKACLKMLDSRVVGWTRRSSRGIALPFSGRMLVLWLQGSNPVSSLCTFSPALSCPELGGSSLDFPKAISAPVRLLLLT